MEDDRSRSVYCIVTSVEGYDGASSNNNGEYPRKEDYGLRIYPQLGKGRSPRAIGHKQANISIQSNTTIWVRGYVDDERRLHRNPDVQDYGVHSAVGLIRCLDRRNQ